MTPRTKWKYVGPGLNGGDDELEDNAALTRAKRKKELTGNEILEKLEENESDVSKAVRDMLEELCPFDINDDEVLKIEDRLERVDKC